MGGLTMAKRIVIRWAKSERGNIAILFALMFPLVVGGAAYGVETTYWYLTRLQLQTQADAAAMAGAMDKRSGYSVSAITASATKAAQDNGFTTANGATITVNAPPTTGSSGANAVEVILNSTASRYFSAVFTNSTVGVKARSVAKYTTAGNACVLALNPSAAAAANFGGSSALTLTSCSVMSNSVSTSAISVSGSASLTTECLLATGSISVTSGAHMSCSAAVTGAPAVADPFSSLAVPTSATTFNNSNGNTLDPGTYPNGITISPNKTVTFNPGTYIITGGSFKLNNNSVVNCTGCTFYLGPNVDVSWNGGAQVNFTSPATGPYAGMLLFGDRTNTITQKFNGNASSHLTGNIYFKAGTVQYNGNFSGLNGCTQVVADKVDWTGNTSFNVDCTAYGMTPIPAAYAVKLSE